MAMPETRRNANATSGPCGAIALELLLDGEERILLLLVLSTGSWIGSPLARGLDERRAAVTNAAGYGAAETKDSIEVEKWSRN